MIKALLVTTPEGHVSRSAAPASEIRALLNAATPQTHNLALRSTGGAIKHYASESGTLTFRKRDLPIDVTWVDENKLSQAEWIYHFVVHAHHTSGPRITVPPTFSLVRTGRPRSGFHINTYRRNALQPKAAPNSPETQYLELVKELIAKDAVVPDRTGVGTLRRFGTMHRYSLANGTLPLFTTKKVVWKSVVDELLWIISGSTNEADLKCRIWKANGTRAFLRKCGFPESRAVGDLGPIYGFQWRHFGAKYVDHKTDYTGQGVDQLANVIHLIRTNPTSRRIVLSSWNPQDLGLMVLPPCHMSCQFFVEDDGKRLSCCLYQRSGDLGLGVPFNVASYSLLTHMIAHICGLRAHEFVHVIGDAHVYANHRKALRTQVTREPRCFPVLKITRQVKSVDDFRASDFRVEGYFPHKAISMKMAV